MTNLVIRRGMHKLAAAEDGPSFEQQFGIMANAKVAEKYPKLDNNKLMFQLIDKDDDSNKAVGACVYVIGPNVIFVPAFFRNNDIDTGDMMFLAKTQQFLPLSEPWLAWLQSKDLGEAGELMPKDVSDSMLSQDAVTIRDIADPIVKTATVYLRGLLRIGKDLCEGNADASILDTAIQMGKTASADLLTEMSDNVDFLNAALRFYSGDAINDFAKKATDLNEDPAPAAVSIEPFSKEAKLLNDKEREALERDGFYTVKTAAADSPNVIRHRNVKQSFSILSKPGKMQLLTMDGGIKTCLVLRQGKDISLYPSEHVDNIEELPDGEPYSELRVSERIFGRRGEGAARYMKGHKYETGGLCAVFTNDATRAMQLPVDTMTLNDGGNKDFTPDMISGYGAAMKPSSVAEIGYDDMVLCPDGYCYKLLGNAYAHNEGWYTRDNFTVVLGKDPKQKSPIATARMAIFPQGSRILHTPSRDWSKPQDGAAEVKGVHAVQVVTFCGLDAFLTNYIERNYRKMRLTTNGSEVLIIIDSTDGDPAPMSVKEASLHLVDKYNIEPNDASAMLREVFTGAHSSAPKSELFLISKTAADDTMWENANLPASEFQNIGDVRQIEQMPSVLEDPEQLRQAAVTAAENGVKEVFDVTALKLLVRQNAFQNEISKDLPMFMRTLDSLCRKLFLLYCHTEDFEEKYGTVKLKALEDSIRNTLDSLSELTVFFRMRTVSGDQDLGNNGGPLMEGHDL